MGKMSDTAEQKARGKWDNIYRSKDEATKPLACEVLIEYQHLLPSTGSVLDVACGLGGNSLFLAELGLEVTAIDISAVAVDRIEAYQRSNISTLCASIDESVLKDKHFDVIVVSRFLDRTLCSSLINALHNGGLLFYQTFTQEKVNPEVGPGNPEYLLASNELLSLFHGLKVLAFTDQGRVGTHAKGFRNQSWLVAQKE